MDFLGGGKWSVSNLGIPDKKGSAKEVQGILYRAGGSSGIFAHN